MPLFDGMLKPGDGAELMIRRELERRRDTWPHTGYPYRGAGDYFLKHGKLYRGRVLPEEYVELQGEENLCFYNAQTTAARTGLRYVEGVYTTSNNNPTPHAWLLDPDGAVLEITHVTRDLERYVNSKGLPILPPEHWIYFGVIFKPELVEAHFKMTGEYCMFDRPVGDRDGREFGRLDMSQTHDWPILKVPYDPDRTTL